MNIADLDQPRLKTLAKHCIVNYDDTVPCRFAERNSKMELKFAFKFLYKQFRALVAMKLSALFT
jgi:hypothetical protein